MIVTWGPGQADQAQEMLSHMGEAPVVAPEFHSLKTLTAFIERADLFVGNDTGPMHIANAMGTPIVTLFTGYFVLSHGPYWKPRKVLYHPLHKQRGTKKSWAECSGGLDKLDVARVHEACREMLAGCEKWRPADRLAETPAQAQQYV